MSAAPWATFVPVNPIAIPTSAAFKAGASFVLDCTRYKGICFCIHCIIKYYVLRDIPRMHVHYVLVIIVTFTIIIFYGCIEVYPSPVTPTTSPADDSLVLNHSSRYPGNTESLSVSHR